MLTPDGTAQAGPGHSGASVGRVRDEGYWLVLPLLALVLFAFRRGSGLACIAVLALLPALSPLPAAAQAPGATPWQRADQVAHARMRQGAQAYRGQRFEDALESWSGLQGPEAAYNRGNALARLGRFDEAVAAYDAALAAQPGMADALANRAAVEAARKRKPPPGEAGEPPDGTPGEGRNRNSAPSPDRSGPSPSEPPPDVQAQRDAEDAQRERMQRALEGRSEAGSEAGAAMQAPADDAQREREQANAAWLRRVPDDPGGLLRAKFRLEHERRASGGDP